MKLDELLRQAGLGVFEGEIPSIASVTCDSRRVLAGSLFVVINGRSACGSDFVADALDRGAVAIAAEERPEGTQSLPFVRLDDARRGYAALCAAHAGKPAEQLQLVGVTGTNGKTTSTMMIEQMLRHAGREPALIGTVKNVIAGRESAAAMTTPSAEDLHHFLARHVNGGGDCAALEVSSHALDQDRLHGIGLKVAAFTNMARDHLDYHEDVESYHATKRRLLEHLAPGGTAVINADAPEYEAVLASVPEGVRVLRYSLTGREVEVSARIEAMTLRGMELAITIEGRSLCASTRIVGAHNALNILVAVSCAHALGVADDAIVAAIDGLDQIDGRFEVLETNAGFDVLVDYAHSPDAFESMLGCLRALTAGRLRVLFGCGGDRDRGKRPEMGKIAEFLADHIVLTDDNPRSENPDKIAMEIKAGMQDPDKVTYIADRREAILHLLESAEAHDVLLLAGKGHERVQVMKDKEYPHVDREIVADWAAWKDGREGTAP